MTAVLTAMDPLRKDRHASFDDNGLNYSSGGTDWRAKYNEVVDMLAETRAELDEFHSASKELEAELEAELQRTEKAQQDLKVKVSKAESERDDWKTKFMSLQTTHNTTTTSLQRELDKLRQEYQVIKVQLRDLEMGNDDLERNERAISSSLADVEAKYSRVLEEKILLEQELLEKVTLEEESQRLKDELRDANEEIAILKSQIATATAAAKDAEKEKELKHKPSQPSTRSEDNLLRTAPPSDLDLADLSPSSESTPSPSQLSTPKSNSLNKSSANSFLQRASYHAKESPLSALKTSGFARSTLIATLYSPTSSSRLPTRNTPVRSSTTSSTIASSSSTSSTTTSKNKGVQMVSEMRARVKNLEQKIHTRVPRLRMASIGRNSVSSTASTMPSASGSSSSISTGKTSWESQRPSVDSRGSLDTPGTPGKKNKDGDSGWVLIMEDSPSPQKDKRAREQRRLSNPNANGPTSYRPTSNYRATSPTLSTGMPSALSRSTMLPGKQRPHSRLSGGSSSTTATGSSLPTPTSRPTTPTFLPLPSGSLYASSRGLKRSTGPNGPNPYNQTKRSSLGTSTNGLPAELRDRPPSLPPLPKSDLISTSASASERDKDKSLPKLPPLPINTSNITVRQTTKSVTSSSGNISSMLSKSRIGRPPSATGRKSAGGERSGLLDVKESRPRAGSSAGTYGK